MPTRRQVLSLPAILSTFAWGAGASAAPEATTTGGAGLRAIDLRLDGDRSVARRALVLVPDHGTPGTRHAGLVLLHGRGEVGDELTSIHAWEARYGLRDSYRRLRTPPVRLTPEQARYMEPEQLARVNADLARRPFGGLVLICPVTPAPRARGRPGPTLDTYAEWLARTLLPEVSRRVPLAEGRLGIDGCSLGGYVAAEVFVRKPHLFRSFGVVQPAFGAFRVARYARALAAAARAGRLDIHLETSTRDPYRAATEAFAKELARLQTPHTLSVLPGPHNQDWLRAAGTLQMLWWQHRALTS